MRRRLLTAFLVVFLGVQSANSADVWVNDSKKLFQNNAAVIYEINLRTFGAQDINKNGIIDLEEGEESGTFLNAIPRLDELVQKGINTIHILPITPVGKTKALGTAGSLYAASSFNSLNPQLASNQSALSVTSQARKFIDEAHKRKLRVIIDLPSCGAYDLYLQRPELFMKDKSAQAIVPEDWTDVRLFNSGNELAVNKEVYNMFKEFTDMVINLGADGIRADVATNKPAKFWKDLIDYSHKKDPQFLWLAEAYDGDSKPVAQGAVFTPYNKLLEAGFDGYYGGYSGIKDVKNAKELMNIINTTSKNLLNYTEKKSAIGSFTTHDEMSPVLINGEKFSEMIIWLNATLPVNSYFVDGFDTGDNYIYLWANKEAFKTYTDDNYYFVHRGKIDIFNFSRQPGGKNASILTNFILANGIKKQFLPLINNGKFATLKTSSPSVFAYSITDKGQSLIVFGNLNFRSETETFVNVPKLSPNKMALPIKIDSIPITQKGGFKVNLNPGEIQVMLVGEIK